MIEISEAGKKTTLKTIMAYFGMGAAEFQKEWKQLADDDKAQIKNGLGDGTLSY